MVRFEECCRMLVVTQVCCAGNEVNQASKLVKKGKKKRKEKNSNHPFPYPAFLSVRSVSLTIHLAF